MPWSLRNAVSLYAIFLLLISPLIVLGVEEHGEEIPILDTEEALAMDAKWYSQAHSVSYDEALMRMSVQFHSVEIREDIGSLAGDRFAGSWIEHTPRFRIVVGVTGNSPLDGIGVLLANPAGQGHIEIKYGVVHSYRSLLAAMDRVHPVARKFPQATYGIRVSENAIWIETPYSLSTDERRSVLNVAQVPVVFRATAGERAGDQHTRGGRSLAPPGCTTGFALKTASNIWGMLTAAHCWAPGDPDPTYRQNSTVVYPLKVFYEYDDGDEDWAYLKESNAIPNPHPVEMIFYDGWQYRTVTDGDAPSPANMEGDFVCHFGYGSAYAGVGTTCSTVDMPLSYPGGEYCGTPDGSVPCEWEFARVRSTELDEIRCYGGDSGGPWFHGTRAYGIHKSGDYLFNDGPCWFTRTQKVDNHNFDILED